MVFDGLLFYLDQSIDKIFNFWLHLFELLLCGTDNQLCGTSIFSIVISHVGEGYVLHRTFKFQTQ